MRSMASVVRIAPLEYFPSILILNADFMFQNVCPRLPFSIAISYDSTRRLTSALIHNVGKDTIQRLKEYLMSNRDQICVPLLLGTFFVGLRADFQSQAIVERRITILDIESRLGT